MISIQYLNYFLKVCETRSFSRAAEQLYITQPALSMAIRSLEEELKVSLFSRSNRGVVITTAGEHLLHHCEILMRQLSLIESISEDVGNHILSISSFPSLLRPSILSEFKCIPEFKNTAIEYHEGRVTQILQNVYQGVSEIGFLYYNNRQYTAIKKKLQTMYLDMVTLYTGTWGVAVGSRSPLYYCKEINIQQLLPFRHIRPKNDYFSTLFENVRVNNIILQKLKFDIVENAEMVKHLLQQTDMYTFHFYGDDKYNIWKDCDVRIIPIQYKEIKASFAYVTQKKQQLSKEAETFLELVKNDKIFKN